MPNEIRVLVVDDHEVVREGMRLLLAEAHDIQLLGQAASFQEAKTEIARLKPDVVLMDLVLPDGNGIDLTRQLRELWPELKVIILTGSFGDDLRVHEALQAGAIAYLLKDILKADLFQAIRRAAEGKVSLHPEAQEQLLKQTLQESAPHASLTAREMDVLQLIAAGQSNKKIAQLLSLTEGTVKGYVSIVLAKLGVADRTQAALYAHKQGLTRTV